MSKQELIETAFNKIEEATKLLACADEPMLEDQADELAVALDLAMSAQ
jgi:hypothetical protein